MWTSIEACRFMRVFIPPSVPARLDSKYYAFVTDVKPRVG